jgi:hypothetical protein
VDGQRGLFGLTSAAQFSLRRASQSCQSEQPDQELIRTTSPGGKDTIGHSKGGHDDIANSIACACVLALRSESVVEFVWDGIPLPGGNAAKRARAEREGTYAPRNGR